MSQITQFMAGVSLAKVFVIAFIVGLLSIFAGELLNNWVITLFVPLLAMAVYCWAGWKKSPPPATSIRFAESMYFLGFLFTLVAMAVSLLFFSPDDISGVIARFALALITTIVGLTVRIVLVNFRSSLEDTRARVEYDLMEAGTRLRNQLEQTSVDMIAQNNLMNQTLRHASEEVTNELARSVKQSGAALHMGTSYVTDTMESVSESVKVNVETALQRMSKSVEENTKAASVSIQSLVDDIKKASAIAANTFHESMKQSINVLNGAFESLLAKVNTYSNELEEAVKASSLPKDMFVSALKPPLDSLKDYLVKHSEDLKRLADKQLSVEEETASLADAMSELTSLTEKLGQLTEKVQDTVDGVSAVNTEAERLTKALEDASQGLDQYGNSLDEQRGQLKQFRDQIKQDMKAYQRDVQTDLEMIRKYKIVLNNQVVAATQALQIMHRQTTDAAKHILEELKG